ncbi:helix-turn-helix domain-containing protein [Streptomyces sp. NPDC059466]|uniref:helix-turn-helix domain-containing protein n=1 Tax=Streptomyces sp. NPDC059466 TaxID=3346843 RepID=UPI0036C0D4DF
MTQPPAPDWSARLALGVAREVRRHRQAQGLSAQQLADRCAQIGMPIQRSVLANLESGRRTTVNIAELLVLAHALDVPPGVLLFPVGYEQQTEVLPGGYAEPGFAVEWLAGRSFLSREAADVFFESPLGLIRLHQDQATALRRTTRRRDHARQEFADISQKFRSDADRYEAIEAKRLPVYNEIQKITARGSVESEGVPDRLGELIKRHEQLALERDLFGDGARQYRYAAERVQSSEDAVSQAEARLLEIRREIKGEGLEPPLLPRVLSYLDPGRPAFEDIPKFEPGGPSPSSAPIGAEGGMSDAEFPPSDGLETSPPAAPESADLVRSIVEEMKPYIADVVGEAVKAAMEQRRE